MKYALFQLLPEATTHLRAVRRPGDHYLYLSASVL